MAIRHEQWRHGTELTILHVKSEPQKYGWNKGAPYSEIFPSMEPLRALRNMIAQNTA